MAIEEPRVEAIFFATLEKESPEDRVDFLDTACGGDDSLRRRVQELLDALPKLGSFLQGDACAMVGTIERPLTEKAGDTIGPYTLVEQIGEGGMGVVYRAKQTEPIQRSVALKVIKPGMDSETVIARFQAERQALALMDHPHIAKVHDAGTTQTGRPFFVMELVKGIPITDYCDGCAYSTRDRLELFVQVCQAINHAHERGIIHRDIKPSNVLIEMRDGQPSSKVIDFGVAKAMGQRLTEQVLTTGFGQMLGTPLYMSPEQAEMSPVDVDTRSDVYSLGVLLYQLLTGTSPFDEERLRTSSFDELRRIIREEDPPKPSTRLSTLGNLASTIAENRRTQPHRLQRLLRGDLDWIVMKALEKDPRHRYPSANALAADVQRSLDNLPTIARPPSLTGRAVKWSRRHNALVMSTAVILLVSTIALAVSSIVIKLAYQMRMAVQPAEIGDRLERDFPGFNYGAMRRKWAQERSRKLAQYASFSGLREETESQLLQQAIDLVSKTPPAERTPSDWGYLAQYLYRAGEFDESRAAIEKNLTLRNETEPTTELGPRWWYMTMLLARAGEMEKARQYFEILTLESVMLGTSSSNNTYRAEAARLLEVEVDGELAEIDAVDVLERALETNVSNWRAYFAIGSRFLKADQPDEAKLAYSAAAQRLAVIPEERRTIAGWGHLGQALYRAGRYAEARLAFEKDIHLRGETKPTIAWGPRWWYMAMLLARTGESDKARGYYERLTRELKNSPVPNLAVNDPLRIELAAMPGIEEQSVERKEEKLASE